MLEKYEIGTLAEAKEVVFERQGRTDKFHSEVKDAVNAYFKANKVQTCSNAIAGATLPRRALCQC